MTAQTIPNTLFERYAQEREYLLTFIAEARKCVLTLVTGQAQSYSLGNRSVTSLNISEINTLIDNAERRVDEIEGLMCGRSARGVRQHSYLSPSFTIPWFNHNGEY